MSPIHLFDLASRQADWAALRQATVAGNIANADTPGFRARDVAPFEAVLDGVGLDMAATRTGHMSAGGAAAGGIRAEDGRAWDITYSGNSVSLDQELVKAGEANRVFSLDTSIMRAFHRMILASVRSA